MWLRALFFILIIIFIVLGLTYSNRENTKEDFTDTSKLHYEGTVHLKGSINVNNVPNKVRCKQLCFRKTVNGEIKEECLDTGQFSFALNNAPERNYFKCLGEVCIDNKHLDIIKNKKQFKLQNLGNNKCYAMRDVMIHGLGGNYNDLKDSHLNSWNMKRLRYYGRSAGSYWGGGMYYMENMPGKMHDDCGDYWRYWSYTDGNYQNQPWIPNFVVGETCELENDWWFKRYANIQEKNQFRFIKTDLEGGEITRTFSDDTPVPPPSDEYSSEMPGAGIQFKPSN